MGNSPLSLINSSNSIPHSRSLIQSIAFALVSSYLISPLLIHASSTLYDYRAFSYGYSLRAFIFSLLSLFSLQFLQLAEMAGNFSPAACFLGFLDSIRPDASISGGTMADDSPNASSISASAQNSGGGGRGRSGKNSKSASTRTQLAPGARSGGASGEIAPDDSSRTGASA